MAEKDFPVPQESLPTKVPKKGNRIIYSGAYDNPNAATYGQKKQKPFKEEESE